MPKKIKIINVEIIRSSTINSVWRGFIQRITTDIGIFYDNPENINYAISKRTKGFNWRKYIGESINTNLVTFVENSGIMWLKNEKDVL